MKQFADRGASAGSRPAAIDTHEEGLEPRILNGV